MHRYAALVVSTVIAVVAVHRAVPAVIAAPAPAAITVGVCQGPWAVTALPPAADGRAPAFIRTVLRRFQRDPEGVVSAIAGQSNDLYDAGATIWGLSRRASLSAVAEAGDGGAEVALIVPDPASECAPAVGVLVRGNPDFDFALVLATDVDAYGGNSGSAIAFVPAGSGPATVTVAGRADASRVQAYCDMTAGGGGWTALATPGAQVVIYDGGDTGTHELVPTGPARRFKGDIPLQNAVEWIRPCP